VTDEQARQGAAAAAPAAVRTAAEQACADAKVEGSCKNRSARAAVCGAVLAEDYGAASTLQRALAGQQAGMRRAQVEAAEAAEVALHR